MPKQDQKKISSGKGGCKSKVMQSKDAKNTNEPAVDLDDHFKGKQKTGK